MAQNVLNPAESPKKRANYPGLRGAAITAALDHNWPRERIVYMLGCSPRQLQRWIVEAQLERWVNDAPLKAQAQLRESQPGINDENPAQGLSEARWGVLQDIHRTAAPRRRKPASNALAWLTTSANELVGTLAVVRGSAPN